MKKVSGLLLLLLFALLVSMPVVAEPFGVSNEIALDLANIETKIFIQEEVVGIFLTCEMMAIQVEPIKPEVKSTTNILWLPYSGFEVDLLNNNGSIAGGVPVISGES